MAGTGGVMTMAGTTATSSPAGVGGEGLVGGDGGGEAEAEGSS